MLRTYENIKNDENVNKRNIKVENYLDDCVLDDNPL